MRLDPHDAQLFVVGVIGRRGESAVAADSTAFDRVHFIKASLGTRGERNVTFLTVGLSNPVKALLLNVTGLRRRLRKPFLFRELRV